MAKDGGPDWNGLFKWSIAHGDGTKAPRALSEEDRKWFMEAMQANTIDVVKRMKEITQVMKTPEDVLQSQGVTPENIEDMLDELQEHVESIDMANDLHSIGGLDPLLGYLKNSNAGIRAKAAEVVSTIVQNNPKSQQLVMESNRLEPLLTNFKSDPSTNARTKALGAISSLIRHNQPGISAFRLGNGYAGLKDALGSDDARLQRKALNLIQYLLHNNKADRSVATELGLPKLMMHLASSDDSLVREAALSGLLELAQDKTAGNALPDQDKLKDILKSRIDGINAMDSDDLHAAREERQLVDSLWKECYNKPSSLREKGLVVLPGEDAPQQLPPDVAGKMFEPPLRVWAAARPAQEDDSDSGSGKKDPPLMLKF
ncbi:hsp70 nucleotide exchange factor fes1-like [Miscanthus floridulus]|uniref:hsp70 nucleotide exchange factor fes1-like n=1 Tax=Miscanthus floridulus TaxID=154761 RepID=UPI0034575455